MSTGSHTMSPPMSPGMTTIGAPKYGTVVPNRIFVGGISPQTTEEELYTLFSNYGSVKDTKIIIDRAGVSKGYGFVTFENDEEAKKLQTEGDSIVFKDRKLNIAPAVIKQPFSRIFDPSTSSPTGALLYHNGVPYTYHNGMALFPSIPVAGEYAAAAAAGHYPLTLYTQPVLLPQHHYPTTAAAHQQQHQQQQHITAATLAPYADFRYHQQQQQQHSHSATHQQHQQQWHQNTAAAAAAWRWPAGHALTYAPANQMNGMTQQYIYAPSLAAGLPLMTAGAGGHGHSPANAEYYQLPAAAGSSNAVPPQQPQHQPQPAAQYIYHQQQPQHHAQYSPAAGYDLHPASVAAAAAQTAVVERDYTAITELTAMGVRASPVASLRCYANQPRYGHAPPLPQQQQQQTRLHHHHNNHNNNNNNVSSAAVVVGRNYKTDATTEVTGGVTTVMAPPPPPPCGAMTPPPTPNRCDPHPSHHSPSISSQQQQQQQISVSGVDKTSARFQAMSL